MYLQSKKYLYSNENNNLVNELTLEPIELVDFNPYKQEQEEDVMLSDGKYVSDIHSVLKEISVPSVDIAAPSNDLTFASLQQNLPVLLSSSDGNFPLLTLFHQQLMTFVGGIEARDVGLTPLRKSADDAIQSAPVVLSHPNLHDSGLNLINHHKFETKLNISHSHSQSNTHPLSHTHTTLTSTATVLSASAPTVIVPNNTASIAFPSHSASTPSLVDDRLVNLLEELGLSKYIPQFIEEEWDWDSLLEITSNDLLSMGLKTGLFHFHSFFSSSYLPTSSFSVPLSPSP